MFSNIKYKDKKPKISNTAYIAPNAVVAGDVTIGENSSLWFGVVARGDVNFITIGDNTNIQDGTIIHVGRDQKGSTVIGNNITIGHAAVIHACTLEDGCLIGMHSLVMDNAIVEKNALVAAGSLVLGDMIIPEGEMWAGRPAEFKRKLTKKDFDFMEENIEVYINLANEYKNNQDD